MVTELRFKANSNYYQSEVELQLQIKFNDYGFVETILAVNHITKGITEEYACTTAEYTIPEILDDILEILNSEFTQVPEDIPDQIARCLNEFA